MDPERIAAVREAMDIGDIPAPSHRACIRELLADRDYQEQQALESARERDELLRGLANVGNEMDGMEAEFDAMGTAGRVTRAAASLMVTAVRLHPKIETGITCCVEVDGRKMDVIAQWVDAPVVTNWVSMAADMLRGRAEAERERDEARADVADQREKADARVDRLADEWRTESIRLQAGVTRLRARVRVEAEDVERAGVTRAHIEAWLRANRRWEAGQNGVWHWKPSNGGAFTTLSNGARSDELADDVHWLAQREQRPGLDLLDEMAAMRVEPEPRKCTNCDATLKAGEQGECSVCEARRATREAAP
jgi:hypothetical protein